jgi:hypothetical protein
MVKALVMGAAAMAGAFATWMTLRALFPIRFTATVRQAEGPPVTDSDNVTRLPPILFSSSEG